MWDLVGTQPPLNTHRPTTYTLVTPWDLEMHTPMARRAVWWRYQRKKPVEAWVMGFGTIW